GRTATRGLRGAGFRAPPAGAAPADVGLARYRPLSVAPSSKRLAKTPSAEPGVLDYSPNRNKVKRRWGALPKDAHRPRRAHTKPVTGIARPMRPMTRCKNRSRCGNHRNQCGVSAKLLPVKIEEDG